MTHISPEERAAMRESFHRLLDRYGDEKAVRQTMESQTGLDTALWSKMAELGILGLLIDPEFGGIGGGAREINDIMEEVGAHLLCGPFLTSSVLCASLLSRSHDAGAKTRLLPKIADGSLIATAALTGETGDWNPDDITVTAENDVLTGDAHYVLHSETANVILVAAKTDQGIGLFEIEPHTTGVTLTPMKAYDLTLRFSTLRLSGVKGYQIEGFDEAGFTDTIDLARIALAGEQAGGAKHVFDMTLDYIKNRYQFGRAIGGFQAVKHMAADLYIEVESALTASRQAAAALADDTSDKTILLNLASWTCADTFTRMTTDAIQLHGGIAFTWDHPAHLYFRRARADAFLLGSPDYMREEYLKSQEATR